MWPIMKDSTKIDTCLSGKIPTLVFGTNVEIAPQGKQKRNVCSSKMWKLFGILIFRVYFS